MQSSSIYCTSCGTNNPPQATFCFQCGKTIHQPTSSPTVASSTPSSFMHETGRLPLGKILNQRYKIAALLGQGGMGAVYKAEDIPFGNRSVAVKEMRQIGMYPEEVINAAQQFKQEAIILAGLKHPNLPSIYDHFSQHGRWYLVMDFIEGGILQQYLDQQGLLTIPEALDVGIQLSKVLGYLHTRPTPIIFRDLKPLNIMLTPERHIYLIDFGIARLFKPGQAKDTVAYVSAGYGAPEQYGTDQTTAQSDIYSLGATLHQLLSGHHPKSNTPPFTFQSLQTYNPSIPSSLATLVAQMVSMHPAQRPASMLAIRQELEQIQRQPAPSSQQPIYIPSPPPPPDQQQPLVADKADKPKTKPNSVQASHSSPKRVDRVQEEKLSSNANPAKSPAKAAPIWSDQSNKGQHPSNSPIKAAQPSRRFLHITVSVILGIIAGIAAYYLTFSAATTYYNLIVAHPSLRQLAPLVLSLIIIIPAIVGLLAGIITGRIAARRIFGLLTGIVAGITVDVIIFINAHIFIHISTISIIIPVAGLLSWFGAWLATRKPR